MPVLLARMSQCSLNWRGANSVPLISFRKAFVLTIYDPAGVGMVYE